MKRGAFILEFLILLITLGITTEAITAITIDSAISEELESQLRVPVIIEFIEPINYNALSGADFISRYDYESIPALSGLITKEGLARLSTYQNIKAIYLDQKFRIALTESIPAIKADKVWNVYGVTGKDTVCLVDTGVDYANLNLGNCTTESFLAGSCEKIIGGFDFVNNDSNPIDDNGHGTYIAGIIAANGVVKGVAPSARIVAVKAIGSGGEGRFSILNKAIEWCYLNKELYNISVIVLSLGTATYHTSENCDNDFPTTTALINNAYSSGISIVAASGNEASFGISSPACIANVISVGAVDNENKLAAFTNRGNNLDLVAPGDAIASLSLSNQLSTKSGTSASAAHVVGLIALLNQYNKDNNKNSLTPDEIKQLLLDSGNNVSDPYSNLSFVAIDAYSALNSLNANLLLSPMHVDINIDSPVNKEYNSDNLLINVTTSMAESCIYSLNAGANTSLPGNGTNWYAPITASGGLNNLVVSCNLGSEWYSSSTSFTVVKSINFTVFGPNSTIFSGENVYLYFTTNANANGNFSLDQGNITPISGISRDSLTHFNVSLNNPLLVLPNGRHNVSILLFLNNRTSYFNHSFIVNDIEAPVISLNPANSTAYANNSDNYQLTVSIASNEHATVTYKFNNNAFEPVAGFAGLGRSGTAILLLSPGGNTLLLNVTDVHNNNKLFGFVYNFTEKCINIDSECYWGNLAISCGYYYCNDTCGNQDIKVKFLDCEEAEEAQALKAETAGSPTGMTVAKTSAASELWDKVNAGEVCLMRVPSEEIPVKSITFVAVKDLRDSMMTIKKPVVEQAGNLEGIFFDQVQLVLKNIQESDINDLEIVFKVKNSWLSENNVPKENVKLFGYDNDWQELKATPTGSDNEYAYFTTNSKGFKLFSITGLAAAASPEPEVVPVIQSKPEEPTPEPVSLNATDTTEYLDEQLITGSDGLIIWPIILAVIIGAGLFSGLLLFRRGRKLGIKHEKEDNAEKPKQRIQTTNQWFKQGPKPEQTNNNAAEADVFQPKEEKKNLGYMQRPKRQADADIEKELDSMLEKLKKN